MKKLHTMKPAFPCPPHKKRTPGTLRILGTFSLAASISLLAGCAYNELSRINDHNRLRSDQAGTTSLIGRPVQGTSFGEPIAEIKPTPGKERLASALPNRGGILQITMPVPFLGITIPFSAGYKYDIPSPKIRPSTLTPLGFVESETSAPQRIIASELHTGEHSIGWGAPFVTDNRSGIPDVIVGVTYFDVVGQPAKPFSAVIQRDTPLAIPEVGCWAKIHAVPDPEGGSTRIVLQLALPAEGQSVESNAPWPELSEVVRLKREDVSTLPLSNCLLTLPPLALTRGEEQFIFPLSRTQAASVYLAVKLIGITGSAPDSVTVKIQKITIKSTIK